MLLLERDPAYRPLLRQHLKRPGTAKLGINKETKFIVDYSFNALKTMEYIRQQLGVDMEQAATTLLAQIEEGGDAEAAEKVDLGLDIASDSSMARVLDGSIMTVFSARRESNPYTPRSDFREKQGKLARHRLSS